MMQNRDSSLARKGKWARALLAVAPALAIIGTTAVTGAHVAGAAGSGAAGTPSTGHSRSIEPRTLLAPTHFVMTVTSGSIAGSDNAYIENGAAMNDPSALVFVFSTYNPGGTPGGTVDNHPLGVWYSSSDSQWEIFHEDHSSMTVGNSYNVLVVPKQTATAFRWTAGAANIKDDTTYINNPATNGNPNAKLLVTQVLRDGTGDVYNNDSVGVLYKKTGGGSWGIYNQVNFNHQTAGASYNVLVNAGSSGGGKSKIQTTTAANTYDDATFISSPLTDNSPNALIFATNNYNAHGLGGPHGGVGNNRVIGAWYRTHTDKWGVFNEDGSVPRVGSSMNVLLFNN